MNPESPPTNTQPSRRASLAAKLRAAWARPASIIALLALLLLGWQWLETRERLQQVQQEMARRLGEGDSQVKENRLLASQNQENLLALSSKIGGLEAKLAEVQSQRTALEQMYQELLRSRDERLLAEVEQSVSSAAQQLQLAGNVQAALIALQGADARLARAAQAQHLPLRRMLAQDIERLKSLPLTDIAGVSLKLENVVTQIDGMRLAFEHRPKAETASPGTIVDAESSTWHGLLGEFWKEMRQLIRIERMDQPTPALLAPSDAFFLRENLKLRLLNARLALLQRDSKTFNNEVRQAREWLELYFDTREANVSSAISSLSSLGGTVLNLELPTLNDTLSALRSRGTSEKK